MATNRESFDEMDARIAREMRAEEIEEGIVPAENTPSVPAFIEYTVSVYVKRPVVLFNHDDTLAETAEWMQSKDAKRELVREVIAELMDLDGHIDAEVMEVLPVGAQ